MSAEFKFPTKIISTIPALLPLVVVLLKWSAAVLLVGAVVGTLCAFFLWALDMVTAVRFAHPWLLFGLPLAGFVMAFAYLKIGGGADGGNNLIVDRIHEPGGGVPLRMAPLILISTVATHLFGGSAGREGTAVQLGGSIAGGFARLLRMRPEDTRTLLMAGVAAGFGAVFGTPVAGAVFAMEVLTIGRVQYHALIPCLMAAIVGDWVCHGWRIGHIVYAIGYLADVAGPHIDVILLLKVALAGVIFGLVARAFSSLSHQTARLLKALLPYSPLRALVGGLLVIGLVYAIGTREYLGLGVWSPNADDVTILRFFDPALNDTWSWTWKILFTVVTLGAGFKGGEVTPIFFIGAALGHALATLLGAPIDLFAGLGFVAVFAGAANTPLTCVILGIELFGATHTVYLAVACFLAYLCSGHSGIYLSQRMGVSKTFTGTVQHGVTLRHWREHNPSPAERLIRSAINRRNAPITTPIKGSELE